MMMDSNKQMHAIRGVSRCEVKAGPCVLLVPNLLIQQAPELADLPLQHMLEQTKLPAEAAPTYFAWALAGTVTYSGRSRNHLHILPSWSPMKHTCGAEQRKRQNEQQSQEATQHA